MIAQLSSILLAGIIALPQSGFEIPTIPAAVRIKMDVADFNKNLNDIGYETVEYNKDSAQAFAKMMLDNNYLSLSNKADFKIDLNKIDSFVKATNPNGNTNGKDVNFQNNAPSYVIATVEKEIITSVFLSYYVPTSMSPFSPNDLTLWSNLLKKYSTCTLKAANKTNVNHFVFTGSCNGKQLIMQYYPEKDSVAVVIH